MSERPKPVDPERHSSYLPREKKSTKPFHQTPMLDQLVDGPWPSFVTGLKRLAHGNNMMVDVLGQLEHSYKTRPGLLEGRHGIGIRLRRRHHSRFSEVRRHVSRVERVSHAACAAARPAIITTTKNAAPALELVETSGARGSSRFTARPAISCSSARPARTTQHFFDEINEYGFRPRRRRSLRAHGRCRASGRRAARAVELQ